MKQLKINGPIVDDADAWFYDWFGETCTSPKKVNEFLASTNGEPIEVLINSGGGSVFAGSEIYTALKACSNNVSVVVTGLAASIASIIMLAGDSIHASPISQIMIHNASLVSGGDYRDLLHDSLVIDGVSESLASLYAKRMGISVEEVRDLLDKESWFTAEKASEMGLIDGVLFETTPQFVASSGHIYSKEKIAEFKAMIEQKDGLSNPSHFNQRLTSMENQLNGLVSLIDNKKSTQLETIESPFSKFI